MYVFPSCVVVVIRLYLRPCPLKELYANGGIFAGRGSTKSLITNKVCSSISNFFCFICISRRCWRARYGSVDNLSTSHKLDFQPYLYFLIHLFQNEGEFNIVLFIFYLSKLSELYSFNSSVQTWNFSCHDKWQMLIPPFS